MYRQNHLGQNSFSALLGHVNGMLHINADDYIIPSQPTFTTITYTKSRVNYYASRPAKRWKK